MDKTKCLYRPAVTAVMLTLASTTPLVAKAVEKAAEKESSKKSTKTMPAVVVKEKAEEEKPSYSSGITSIGKMNQAAKDVPQSLTIISSDLIEDRKADSLKEALRNVAGLTFNAAEGGRVGDNITIRGFGASSDFYLDGYRDNAQYNREIFNLERVEVLRGPSSMLFGRGSTGGVINQVSKEPELNKLSRATVTAGTNEYYRETVDLNQAIASDAAIRLNVMKTDAESTRDYVNTDRFGIAPSIKWGINTDNEYLLAYSHLQYDDLPDFGIPNSPGTGGRPIGVPTNTFYGLPDVDYQRDEADVYTGRWKHKFNENNDLKVTYRSVQVDRDLRAVNPSFTAPNTVNRGRQARGAVENTETLAADYSSKFELFNMPHESLTGLEYSREMANRWSYNNPGGSGNPATTAFDPNPFPTLPVNYPLTYIRINPLEFEAINYSAYLQDLIEFIPNWKLLLGVRHDEFSADYKNTTTSGPTTTTYNRHDGVESYRSGLMYQPDDSSTYYVSYGTSFNPSGDVYAAEAATAAGRAQNTDPEENINTEVGGKWELYGGALSLRTALFRSEKTNERNTDPTLTTEYLLSGHRHTDGIEIEANGKATDKWEIFGAIAFMDAQIDKQINPFGEGLVPANAPHFSGSFWNTYEVAIHWKVGGGMDFVGERKGYSISTTTPYTAPTIRKIPGFARFDGMVEYDVNKKYSIKLNMFNLLDKEYFESIYPNGGWGVPGTGRAAQLTLSYKF